MIELLVVVGIIGLLAVFAAPAISSIGQARGVGEATYQITQAIELARSEAVARRTFVWLGLQEQTNSGNRDLLVGMVYSKDGTTNHAAANLQPIGRPLAIRQVGLTNSVEVPGTPLQIAGFTSGIAMQIGQAATFTDRRTLTFTPAGEVLTLAAPSPTAPFNPLVAFGLAAARGTVLDENNIASIAIDGSTGIPTIYRK
jgi:Tfp pilus assembly protein FimT